MADGHWKCGVVTAELLFSLILVKFEQPCMEWNIEKAALCSGAWAGYRGTWVLPLVSLGIVQLVQYLLIRGVWVCTNVCFYLLVYFDAISFKGTRQQNYCVGCL